MARDRLVDEIRQAQLAIRRSEAARGAAPSPPPPPPRTTPATVPPPPSAAAAPRDPRASLRHLISELATRLDRTQEQLLARLGDLNERARHGPDAPAAPAVRAAEPARPALATTDESALLRTLVEKLGNVGNAEAGPRVEERLSSLETLLRSLTEQIATRPPAAPTLAAELGARLDAIESKLVALPARGDAVVPVDTADLEARLESIEERLGGDAGAVTLGAAIARLHERLDRIESTLGGLGSGLSAAQVESIDERLDRILGATLEHRSGSDEAKQTVATLKRDFSLLVHTINGHLQESRSRADQMERALAEIEASLAPIARHVGVEVDRS